MIILCANQPPSNDGCILGGTEDRTVYKGKRNGRVHAPDLPVLWDADAIIQCSCTWFTSPRPLPLRILALTGLPHGAESIVTRANEETWIDGGEGCRER